jgi:alkylmercury lyase
MAAERLEGWARRVVEASPKLETDQQRFAAHIYHLMVATGEPVTTSQIASSSGVPLARIEESLDAWPLVLRDEEGRVFGFWGLHVEPITPTHAMDVDGTTVYGWCAWDTLFITEILGRETRVTSTDPWLKTPVRLTVTPNGVTSVDPPEAVVSLLLPKGGFTDETIQRFCHRIHFFSSPESARSWIGDRPDMFTVTVDEAFELGRITNSLRLGEAIDRVRGEITGDRQP